MNGASDGVVAQSAAIPYRVDADGLRILIITSRRRKRWLVPKGIVEHWQSPREAAIEEALEEAGVRGAIVGKAIGTYQYEKWGGICRVDVFMMRVSETLDSWPESGFRDRRWVDIDTALDLVDNADLRRLIEVAAPAMK